MPRFESRRCSTSSSSVFSGSPRRALRRTVAGDRERADRGPRQARVPGGLAARGIGRVEHERIEPVGVAEGIRLAEVGAVGVAVEGDPLVAERFAYVVDVVGGRRGPVGGGAVAQPARALGDRDPFRRPPLLHVGAVDGLGAPRPPHVDEHQRVRVEERAEELHVGVGAERARVARATLDGEDRLGRLGVAVVRRAHGIADARHPDRLVGALERHLDLAAAKALDLRHHGATVKLGRRDLAFGSGRPRRSRLSPVSSVSESHAASASAAIPAASAPPMHRRAPIRGDSTWG